MDNLNPKYNQKIYQIEIIDINEEQWYRVEGDNAFESILAGWNKNRDNYLDGLVHKRVVVQAGGYCGIFPRKLSFEFDRVYTFEPEPTNFLCLTLNCQYDNIFPCRGVLGDTRGMKSLSEVNINNRGMCSVRGDSDKSMVPCYRIDDMDLPCCDLIFLDVERYEHEVLKGAHATIKKFKPNIIVEDTNPDIERYLEGHGYTLLHTLNRDSVYHVKA